MVRHYLKIWPDFFTALVDGDKNFELRKNDRSFQVGDILHLREYDPVTKTYSGHEAVRWVTYVLAHQPDAGCAATFGLMPDYVIMGIAIPSTDRQPPNSICKFCDRRTFEPCSSYIQATTACTFSLPSSAQDNTP